MKLIKLVQNLFKRASEQISQDEIVNRIQVLRSTKSMKFNTFDIDGVIFINKTIGGLYPGPHDVIITGRSVDESVETFAMLKGRGIKNLVFFNDVSFEQKTRESSGHHKAAVLNTLLDHGFSIGCHFEDDQIQAAEIQRLCPRVPVILIGSNKFTNLENVRHLEY